MPSSFSPSSNCAAPDVICVVACRCSEGVWHNSWLGTSYVLSARQIQAHDAQRAEELMDSAHQLAESLYTLARDTDGCLRRRTASGAWEDVEDEAVAAAVEAAGETAAFYAPSTERRSIANAAAVVFFSFLAEDSAEDDIARVRLAELGAAFTRTFFDTGCCRFRRSDGGDDYWRAADQCVANPRHFLAHHLLATSIPVRCVS